MQHPMSAKETLVNDRKDTKIETYYKESSMDSFQFLRAIYGFLHVLFAHGIYISVKAFFVCALFLQISIG